MNKASNIHNIHFHSAKPTSIQFEKKFQSLLLKINVAINVNIFENLKCKIIYKEGNEVKSLINEINNFKDNVVYLENNTTIDIHNLIDIKF